jgi:hypothetical protein
VFLAYCNVCVFLLRHRPPTSSFRIELIADLKVRFGADSEIYEFANTLHHAQAEQFSDFDDRLQAWRKLCAVAENLASSRCADIAELSPRIREGNYDDGRNKCEPAKGILAAANMHTMAKIDNAQASGRTAKV